MSKSNILSAFNDQFTQFIEDVSVIFPDDPDVKFAKKSFTLMKSMNPRLIATSWQTYVYVNYKEQIDQGNFDFFVNKDYSDDLSTVGDSKEIMEIINRLRKPISNLSDDDKKKTLKYLQNLSKLSNMYSHM
jgi:hypothetical protein